MDTWNPYTKCKSIDSTTVQVFPEYIVFKMLGSSHHLLCDIPKIKCPQWADLLGRADLSGLCCHLGPWWHPDLSCQGLCCVSDPGAAGVCIDLCSHATTWGSRGPFIDIWGPWWVGTTLHQPWETWPYISLATVTEELVTHSWEMVPPTSMCIREVVPTPRKKRWLRPSPTGKS